jgi:spore coat polysaccharide biosynthesis protein SpsF
MKCGAVILARTNSTRFPGKALARLNGKSIIEWCIDGTIGEDYVTILATSEEDADVPLREIAEKKGIPCFRGPLENVAERVLGCIRAFDLEYFARVNGDSPFVRNELISSAFKIAVENDLDFVSNLVPRAFPYGISVEVVRSSVFEENYRLMGSSIHKEHITSFFYENIGKFRTHFITYDGNDHDVRLTVDTPQDLERLQRMLSFASGAISELGIKSLVSLYRESERT